MVNVSKADLCSDRLAECRRSGLPAVEDCCRNSIHIWRFSGCAVWLLFWCVRFFRSVGPGARSAGKIAGSAPGAGLR